MMPWSPIPKFPEIIRELKRRGKTHETDYETLRISVMSVTGLIRDKSIKNAIRAMQDLGYLRMKPNGVAWEIMQDKLYSFPSERFIEKFKNAIKNTIRCDKNAD